MRFFNDLKKYMWIIVVLALVTSNAYNIEQNMKHCNRNAKATILLASGVELLADTFTGFIHYYVGDRTRTGEILKELSVRDLNNKSKILKNLIKITNNRLEICGNTIDNIETILTIRNLHKKPTYKYLKSVTVFVIGETTIKPYIDEANPDGKAFEQTIQWCGTGVIVKMDVDNTYILTNKHVAGGYEETPVKVQILNGKEKILCEIVKMSNWQDLALLKIKGSIKNKAVVKGLAFPTITEKVYTVGHSLGRPYIYGEGVFSGTIIQHDIYQLPAVNGQSGSGVFNRNGELLGLIYSGSATFIKGNIAWDFTRVNVVKGIYVKEFLEGIL